MEIARRIKKTAKLKRINTGKMLSECTLSKNTLSTMQYVQDNYWYVLASDYTDIILPNLGYSTSLQKPLSDKFQIMKNPLAD